MGHIECMRCSLLQLMILSSVSLCVWNIVLDGGLHNPLARGLMQPVAKLLVLCLLVFYFKSFTCCKYVKRVCKVTIRHHSHQPQATVRRHAGETLRHSMQRQSRNVRGDQLRVTMNCGSVVTAILLLTSKRPTSLAG